MEILNKNKLRCLSLFDGISGCQQALKNLGIECEIYASEIDKYAIQITQKNFPNTVQLGDVRSLQYFNKTLTGTFNAIDCTREVNNVDIDLLCGGSPCQDLSIAKKGRKGLDGERSGLFYEYVRILKEVKPKFFILENVASMSKESKELITKELFNIEPIMINSSLLTAQQRKRLYWIGELQEDGTYKQITIKQPQDKRILLKDILESGEGIEVINQGKEINKTIIKSHCLMARDYKGFGNQPMSAVAESICVASRGRNIVDGKRCDVKGAKTEQRLEPNLSYKTNTLTSVQKDNLILQPIDKVKYEIIKKQYEKRTNNIDIEFNKYLKEQKISSKKTIQEISDYCNESKTTIEHYFRLDSSRAIPNKEVYLKLKEIINLDNRFDKHINETEILESTFEQNLRLYDINYKAPTLTSSGNIPIRVGHFNKGGQGDRIYSIEGKSINLSANGGGRGACTELYKMNLPIGDYLIRSLTPIECERLQGFDDNYTNSVSKTQRLKALGNSFTVPVIEHILKAILYENNNK
jgi:DNA (cytosine-5)-methyltransferase 3A